MTIQRVHGLTVSSPLELGPSGSPGPLDVEIALGAVLPSSPEPPEGEVLLSFAIGDAPIYSASAGPSSFCLRAHSLCDFELDPDLFRATCRPDPGADLAHVALVARGAFLAFWFGLTGDYVLHASAVERGGSAVAFVGGSGMGKSTLAAWACAAGARLITDDLLRLGTEGHPCWIGHSPELRLRPGAVELASGHEHGWEVGSSVDGRVVVRPPAAPGRAGPIGAVVIPSPSRSARRVSVERLDPVMATLCLARFPRLEGWRLPRVVATQLEGSTRVAERVPVYVAQIPWGPPFPSAPIEELLSAVAPRRDLEQATELRT